MPSSLMPRRRRLGRRAFSLIEIMFALSIAAIVAATAIHLLKGNVPTAKKKAVRFDIEAISAQLLNYQVETSMFPTTEQGLKALVEKPAVEPIPESWEQCLSELPRDPWGTPYQYHYPGKHNPKGYDLYSLGPDRVESDDDMGNWSTSTGGGAAAGNGNGGGN